MPTKQVQQQMNNDQRDGNMGVKVYNLVILIVDIVMLLVKSTVHTLEYVYRLFVPIEEASVTGENVMITGTGHGIGKQLALQYSALGANVICIDINEKGNQETVAAIKSKGGQAHGYTCDVTKRDKIFELAELIKTNVGPVSIVINNAGIMPTHPLFQQTEAEILKTFEINVFAHFWILQAFVPDMLKRNKGHVVALASIAGIVGLKNLVPYCGTKFAVNGLMESFGEEIRNAYPNSNLKLTTVFPYMVDTGLCKKPHMRFQNLMKLLKPEEVASQIIQAQRRGLELISVPRYILSLNSFMRNFPPICGKLLSDFLDSGVESDM